MNSRITTSFQRNARLVFSLGLLLSLLGVLVSGDAQEAPRPLKVSEAVVKENAQTLRARAGFDFVKVGKQIRVVERKTRRFVALSDGICGGGCSACSSLLDFDGKIKCLGCNANSACKLTGAF